MRAARLIWLAVLSSVAALQGPQAAFAVRSAPKPSLIAFAPFPAPPTSRPCASRSHVGRPVEWATEALGCGWTRDELFALSEAFAKLSRQGAAWLVGDATVTEITANAITIRSATGATKRIYRGD